MKHISSRDNPLYKRMLRLAGGKRDAGMDVGDAVQRVLLEGAHLCQAWLDYAGPPELALFDAEKLAAQEELKDLARALDPSLCLSCDSRLAKGLSQVEHGQGVYFVVPVPAPQLPARIDRNCLWLDRIQDPGNVGTLLRTAAAAGMDQAYLSQGCAAAWSPKVLRSAQGAHFVMAIHEQVDLMALRERLTVPLVATALENARSLYEAPLPKDCAWVLGNEGRGVAADLLSAADRRVFIPQAENVESLNVAIAAGVCLFEQRRQHGLPS
ncbi:MAG: RNA methyltransferase [Burkholderiaceae bacterium]